MLPDLLIKVWHTLFPLGCVNKGYIIIVLPIFFSLQQLSWFSDATLNTQNITKKKEQAKNCTYSSNKPRR